MFWKNKVWKSLINISCSKWTESERAWVFISKACWTERKVESSKEKYYLNIWTIIYFLPSVKHKKFNQIRSHQKEEPGYFNKEVCHLIFFRELLTIHLSSSSDRCWHNLHFTDMLWIAAILKHLDVWVRLIGEKSRKERCSNVFCNCSIIKKIWVTQKMKWVAIFFNLFHLPTFTSNVQVSRLSVIVNYHQHYYVILLLCISEKNSSP